MNMQEAKEIRELTTAEVDEVTGGGSIIGDAIRAAWDYVLSNDLIIDFCGNTTPHLA
jgi:hypothetical protein